MPQMAPLWWTMLMIMFLVSLMVFMNYLYFNMEMKLLYNNIKNKSNMIWKW
nr:ATP synthase F0 subunit 8 [Shaddai sp. SL-2021a]